MDKKDLLIEIGCEEIPVDYILPALEQMKQALTLEIKKNHLTFDNIEADATSRRFVLKIKALEEKQPTVLKELRITSYNVCYTKLLRVYGNVF